MRWLAALLPLVLVPAPSAAAEFSSAYTDFDLSRCVRIEKADGQEFYGTWSCKGFRGLPLTYAEGDLRGMLAVGKNGKRHCAMVQTFGPFNSPGSRIEWRLKNGKAIAMILRWKVSDPERSDVTHDWLAVTKWTARDSCRVAVVQGSLKNANALARQAADQTAEEFDCARDEARVYSESPMAISAILSASPCPPP